MKTDVKRTVLLAALLLLLAAAAPFLCLLPLFAPSGGTDSAGSSSSSPSEAPQDREEETPHTAPQPILLWDDAAGEALSVSAKEYLMGAAACEMPPDWPEEAILAQMVASHSWALYQLEHSDQSDSAITVNSAQCSGWTTAQVLQSRWGEDFDARWEHLSQLAEEVLCDLVLYDDAPAAACYHAISAGHTQASQRVWVEALPYLQGVDSAWDKNAEDFEVSVQYDAQQVSDALYAYLGIEVSGNPDSWVGGTTWDDAGYVDTIEICGQSVSGTELRSALSLRSACFAIAWQDGEFTVTTRGYGHGVGLSQEGARAMAAGGASWQDILSYYFPGTRLGTTDDLA